MCTHEGPKDRAPVVGASLLGAQKQWNDEKIQCQVVMFPRITPDIIEEIAPFQALHGAYSLA